MRKCVLAAVALVCTFSYTMASEVLFVSFDAVTKELKVKENKGAPETTYKVTEGTQFKVGDKEFPAEKAMKRLEKLKKGKLEVISEKGIAKEIKFAAPKPKANKK
ncbi:MAG: hypothetical protein LC104_18475 [Bacteroidales bacterium]|nr:hypothetical protein [Bacteroidales bacterium]